MPVLPRQTGIFRTQERHFRNAKRALLPYKKAILGSRFQSFQQPVDIQHVIKTLALRLSGCFFTLPARCIRIGQSTKTFYNRAPYCPAGRIGWRKRSTYFRLYIMPYQKIILLLQRIRFHPLTGDEKGIGWKSRTVPLL